MNNADKQYLSLLEEIVRFGVEKDTRAGRVKSIFGKQLRFDLKEGFPLLTTKKVFTKGVIHELLWFLQRPYNSHGSMNIEYLVRNGVHIWDDDAYRWFKTTIADKGKDIKDIIVCVDNDDDFMFNITRKRINYEYWIENEAKSKDKDWLKNVTKEEFLDLTLQKVELRFGWAYSYRFGDLGPVYGTQWRHFGDTSIDQIYDIINTLKTNPNDRRMLCVAWNPEKIEDMALPPCHVMFQFYARELSREERMKIFNDRYMKKQIPKKWHDWFEEYSKDFVNNDADVTMPSDGSDFDIADIPRYALSCMWTQRSVDVPLGLPFNIASYALLTHMVAEVVNMVPDELIASLGDTHIYMNQMDGVMEQLNRNGSELPKLKINRKVEILEDFKYEDFEIEGYNPDPPIKYPLSVG